MGKLADLLRPLASTFDFGVFGTSLGELSDLRTGMFDFGDDVNIWPGGCSLCLCLTAGEGGGVEVWHGVDRYCTGEQKENVPF